MIKMNVFQIKIVYFGAVINPGNYIFNKEENLKIPKGNLIQFHVFEYITKCSKYGAFYLKYSK